VKNNVVQIVLAFLVLIVGGAAEELLPKAGGVGFPLLLAAVVYFSPRRRAVLATAFALIAGAVEDVLCGLPLATSASFFLVLAALARWRDFPQQALLFAFPVYQVWLSLLSDGARVGVFGRICTAVPAGFLTTLAVAWILARAERKAAIDAGK
jgi:hypothetical protein